MVNAEMKRRLTRMTYRAESLLAFLRLALLVEVGLRQINTGVTSLRQSDRDRCSQR